MCYRKQKSSENKHTCKHIHTTHTPVHKHKYMFLRREGKELNVQPEPSKTLLSPVALSGHCDNHTVLLLSTTNFGHM